MTDWSYWRVLRGGRLGAFLAGCLISNVGNGMIITALPVLTLQIRDGVPGGLAIALTEGAPYVLATVLALALSLTRLLIPPRALLIGDCVLRGVLFTVLGVLAITGALDLWLLIVILLTGSVFQIAAMSGRRLVATGMTGPEGQLAVNGLLGVSTSLAAYAIGPLAGGVVSAAASPGAALIVDGATFVVMLAVTCLAAPQQPRQAGARAGSRSGLRILLDSPAAARLLVTVFFFNLCYMPVEVALPLLVHGRLHGGAAALGLIWSGFGAGALLGGTATIRLRRFRRGAVLVAIIAAWSLAVFLLAAAPSVSFAVGAFFAGGLVYAPFTPIVYTYVQSMLAPEERQPVITLWSTGSILAGPLGLAIAGPLVTAAGAEGGLIVSALLTVVLVPLAGIGLRDRGHVTLYPWWV